MKILKIYLLAIPVLWLLSCAAPHDNPLDPASPNYVEPTPPAEEPTIPTFSTSVRSVHKGRAGIDLYSLKAELWPDSNMLIDSVTVQYKNTTPRSTVFQSVNGHWLYTFNANNLGTDDLEAAVGEPFYFHVYAPHDSLWHVGPAYFIRVMHETPVAESPSGGESVGAYPDLMWENYAATFPYHYRVFVERVDRQFATIDTVWKSDSLGAAVTSVTVQDSLSDSVPNQASDSLYYQWAVIAYDNFGNSAVSIESVFNVDYEVGR